MIPKIFNCFFYFFIHELRRIVNCFSVMMDQEQPHQVGILVISNLLHCNENPMYVFFFWDLRGLSPNFHVHVSVSYL